MQQAGYTTSSLLRPPLPLRQIHHRPQRWRLGTAGTRRQDQSCWTQPEERERERGEDKERERQREREGETKREMVMIMLIERVI